MRNLEGHEDHPRSVSEYIVVPEINLKNDTLKLPDDVGFEDGTLVEPTACVVKSLRRSLMKKGDAVRDGAWRYGADACSFGAAIRCRKVIGVDMVRFRLEKSLEFGADHVIDISREDLVSRVSELTKGAMAQTVIVGPNSVEAMMQGLGSVARGGTVVFFTPAKPGETLTINPNELYFRDIRISTSYSCGPDDTKEALRFIQKEIVSAEKLVTNRFSIPARNCTGLSAYRGSKGFA